MVHMFLWDTHTHVMVKRKACELDEFDPEQEERVADDVARESDAFLADDACDDLESLTFVLTVSNNIRGIRLDDPVYRGVGHIDVELPSTVSVRQLRLFMIKLSMYEAGIVRIIKFMCDSSTSYAIVGAVPLSCASITLPRSISYFDDCRFELLQKLDLSRTLITLLPSSAFVGTHLQTIILPPRLRMIPERCFAYSEITSMEVPNGCVIMEEAFTGCGRLCYLTLPDTLVVIPKAMCYNCMALESIDIPPGVVEINRNAFQNCASLTKIVFPNVRSIHDGAFALCRNVVAITLGDGLQDIGKNAFFSCCALTSLHLPRTLTSIGKHAFANCSALERVTHAIVVNPILEVEEEAFADCPKLRTCRVNGVIRLFPDVFRGSPVQHAIKIHEM
jgi:hypothetical protein